MSRNMVQAGHTVRGFDISATACEAAQSNGVEIAESIADAVRDADAVFTMLQSAKVVEQVVTGPDGAFANLPKGTVVVDCDDRDRRGSLARGGSQEPRRWLCRCPCLRRCGGC